MRTKISDISNEGNFIRNYFSEKNRDESIVYLRLKSDSLWPEFKSSCVRIETFSISYFFYVFL